MIEELDGVRLLVDLPERGLRKGALGTVLLIHTSPSLAYEVEFMEAEGDHFAIEPEKVERALDSARAFLAEHQIDPSEATEVTRFADGSMSILMQRGEALWHKGIEFSPDLTAELALAFQAVGVPVEHREG